MVRWVTVTHSCQVGPSVLLWHMECLHHLPTCPVTDQQQQVACFLFKLSPLERGDQGSGSLEVGFRSRGLDNLLTYCRVGYRFLTVFSLASSVTVPPTPLSGLALFLIVFFSLVFSVFAIVIGIILYNKWQDQSRKRFY